MYIKYLFFYYYYYKSQFHKQSVNGGKIKQSIIKQCTASYTVRISRSLVFWSIHRQDLGVIFVST